MDQSKSRLPLVCALLALAASTSVGATISLDDAGASDPPLSTPFINFPTDSFGSFAGTFTNVSSPPVDFTFLELDASFSAAFWFSPDGPLATGIFCNPGNVYTNCSVSTDFVHFSTVIDFFGLDATHLGLRAGQTIGANATGFEPNTIVGAAPEPAGFALAGSFFALLAVFVGRKKLLKLRVRT